MPSNPWDSPGSVQKFAAMRDWSSAAKNGAHRLGSVERIFEVKPLAGDEDAPRSIDVCERLRKRVERIPTINRDAAKKQKGGQRVQKATAKSPIE